jgi:hypothetical protein
LFETSDILQKSNKKSNRNREPTAMSRLSHVPVSDWPTELREFVQADTATDIELGITRMLAHAPQAAMGPLQFGASLVMNRSLP